LLYCSSKGCPCAFHGFLLGSEDIAPLVYNFCSRQEWPALWNGCFTCGEVHPPPTHPVHRNSEARLASLSVSVLWWWEKSFVPARNWTMITKGCPACSLGTRLSCYNFSDAALVP
jgi:hypothetical protein